MKRSAILLGLGLLVVGGIMFARLHFAPAYSEQQLADVGLAGALSRIYTAGNLYSSDFIGASLGLQLGPATQTRGAKEIHGQKKDGRFLQYAIVANNGAEINASSFYYIVFAADGEPSQLSAELYALASGCVTQDQIDRSLGALTRLSPGERSATRLMKTPPTEDGIILEVGLTRGCLKEFRMTQDSSAK